MNVSSGVLDNDPKGHSGRGTKFWTIVKVGDAVHRYEYFLMDLLDGTFDLDAILEPLRTQDAKERQEKESRIAAEKKQHLESRQAAVSISPALDKIITDVIANNQKIVAEVRGGREKAINSLVGLVISEIKKQKLSDIGDAFAIMTALKQKLQ